MGGIIVVSPSVRDMREGGGVSPTHAPPVRAALTLLPSTPVSCHVTCAQGRPRGQAGDGGVPFLTCWLCEPPGSPVARPPGLGARGEAGLCSPLCRARGPTGLSVGSAQGPGGGGVGDGETGALRPSAGCPSHATPLLLSLSPGVRSGWKWTRLRGREEPGAGSAPPDLSCRAVGARLLRPPQATLLSAAPAQPWPQGP